MCAGFCVLRGLRTSLLLKAEGFNLKKYERTSSLTDLGRYVQIETHRHIFTLSMRSTAEAHRRSKAEAHRLKLVDVLKSKSVVCAGIRSPPSSQFRKMDWTCQAALSLFLSGSEPRRFVEPLRLHEATDRIDALVVATELIQADDYGLPIPSDIRSGLVLPQWPLQGAIN
jgi:hypothetical protein